MRDASVIPSVGHPFDEECDHLPGSSGAVTSMYPRPHMGVLTVPIRKKTAAKTGESGRGPAAERHADPGTVRSCEQVAAVPPLEPTGRSHWLGAERNDRLLACPLGLRVGCRGTDRGGASAVNADRAVGPSSNRSGASQPFDRPQLSAPLEDLESRRHAGDRH